MRKRGKTDANQAEIVAVLRRCGFSVQSLASVGNGCPDLLVGRGLENFLLEVKDGQKPASKQRLTEDEEAWHGMWRGQVTTVNSADEALRKLGQK